MKTSIKNIIAIFAFAFIIASCSGILEDTENKSFGQKASIIVNVGSDARAIMPSYYENITSIVFKGKFEGKQERILKNWESYEREETYNGETHKETICAMYALEENPTIGELDAGKWEFTLECYNKDSTLICSGTTSETLTAGSNILVHFELTNSEGSGGVEITLNPYAEIGRILEDLDYTIEAQLKKLDGTDFNQPKTLELVVPDNITTYGYSATYTATEIPAGSYIVAFTVYYKGEKSTTVSELVNIAPNITTTGYIYLTSLNKSYPINYSRYVYKYYTDVWETEIDDFESSWIVGNVPLSYTEYDTITLPTVNEVLKPCEEYETYDNIIYYTSYAFDGWYLDEDLIQPIEKIIGSELSGDVSLYAKFERFNMSYYTSAFKGVNDDKGEISVEFSTSAAIPEDWFKQIKFSWKNGGIVSLGNTEPEFEYSYEQGWTTGIFTFKNAHVLEFGSDVLAASIKGVPIAKIGVDTSVLTADIINAFYPDAGNTTEITLPRGYTSMESYLFCYDWTGNKYTKLETVNIPESYTSIGDYAFANCDTITTVNIPDTVTWIGYFAFGGNSSKGCAFGSITIPASVESIDNYAFAGCRNLKTVIIKAETPPTIGSYTFDSTVESIYVPKGSVEDYKESWKEFTSYVRKVKAIEYFVSITVDFAQESDYEVELDDSENPFINVVIPELPDGVTYEKIVVDGTTCPTTKIDTTDLAAGTHSVLLMFSDGKSSYLTFTLEY